MVLVLRVATLNIAGKSSTRDEANLITFTFCKQDNNRYNHQESKKRKEKKRDRYCLLEDLNIERILSSSPLTQTRKVTDKIIIIDMFYYEYYYHLKYVLGTCGHLLNYPFI